jgi:hypothetical protein
MLYGNTIVPQCPNGCRNVFWNCEFKMTAAKLLPPNQNIGMEVGISLNNVHDVDIESATPGATKFIGFNSTTGRMNKAIESIDAEFEASKISFTNCNYGINCESSVGANYSPHFFTENTFNSCYYGIRMRNGLNDQISDNTFNPNAGAYSRQKSTTLPNKYGVYLDASSGTKILGNTFTNLEYGLTIVNSGANGAFVSRGIYGNASTFTNCFRGLNTLGNNSKVNVKCTNFTSNTTALGFGAHWYISGQLKNQGLAGYGQPNSGSPAGNTFQHNSGIDIIAVKNTASFVYYYNNTNEANPSISGLVSKSFVNAIASCNLPELMVLAGNEPALAEQLISDETDDDLKAIYVSQLSFWYENKGQEQERIALLIAQNEEYANEQLLPLLMERKEYQAAMDLLQDYLGTGNPENDDYYAVNEMQLEWALNAKTAFDMTTSEEATLRDIAEHFTRASASARVILNQVFNAQYEAPYYTDTAERKGYFEESILIEPISHGFEINPNPASDNAIIYYVFPEGIEKAELILYTVTNQVQQKYILDVTQNHISIATKQLPSALYLCKLLGNDVLIDKLKLVVSH